MVGNTGPSGPTCSFTFSFDLDETYEIFILFLIIHPLLCCSLKEDFRKDLSGIKKTTMRHCQIPVSLPLPGSAWSICANSRRSWRVPARTPAAEPCWRLVLQFLLLSPPGGFCCLAPRGKVYFFCDDDASHYVKTNLWPGQGVVEADLGSGLAVPANAFVPRAVLIYSLASIVITNAPSLFSLLQADNLREILPET